jgi:hypothetical protein
MAFTSRQMKLEQRIDAFITLGEFLEQFTNNKRNTLFAVLNKTYYKKCMDTLRDSVLENPWFIEPFVRHAIGSIARMLEEKILTQWTGMYPLLKKQPSKKRTVGVIMAGNIPLVGFHDFLCVLLAGHEILVKPSSRDDRLLREVAGILCSIDPDFDNLIRFTDGPLQDVDTIIATGSDSSARYFEYYFRKYHHILRKNRNSIAVLTGSESHDELSRLGDDICLYFGLGCRNVSFVFLPEGMDPRILFPAVQSYAFIADHPKYANNYLYHKSVYLMNHTPFLDNGFLLLREDPRIGSPLGVLHYSFYRNWTEIQHYIGDHAEQIQCVVSISDKIKNHVTPGNSQQPMPWDYADGVDTLQFLTGY